MVVASGRRLVLVAGEVGVSRDGDTSAQRRKENRAEVQVLLDEASAASEASALEAIRRAMKGELPIFPKAQALIGELMSGPSLEAPEEGFLAAGHVCTVMGTAEYEPLAERYRIPIVVTGFEALDRVWTGPEHLPTLDEIKRPQLWLERVA